MFFHWSLSDSKSSQVSRTLLSILADHNYGLALSSDFQLHQPSYQVFGDRSKRNNNN